MADSDVLSRIHDLVEEEHRLRDGADHDQARLRAVEEQLDQCWDLLRQRRARREFGQPEGEVQARSTDTVEHYEQ
jgi:hypothetical protein